jgi:hypothetical protein
MLEMNRIRSSGATAMEKKDKVKAGEILSKGGGSAKLDEKGHANSEQELRWSRTEK